MNLNEAKKILLENNYILEPSFLGEATILNEATAIEMLKKIPNLLNKFKKRAEFAKKENDRDELNNVSDDAEKLEQEIKERGLLDKFKNSESLKKVIFGALASLMLAGGATNAFAVNNGGDIWSNMDKEITAACQATGQDPGHCYIMHHTDPKHSITVTGQSSNNSNNASIDTSDDPDDIVLKTVHREMMTTKSGEDVHYYKIALADHAGHSGGYWSAIMDDDGHVWLSQNVDNPEYKLMNKGQLKWMLNHGFDLRK